MICVSGAGAASPGPSPALFVPPWVSCLTDANVLRHPNPIPDPLSLLPRAPGICAGCGRAQQDPGHCSGWDGSSKAAKNVVGEASRGAVLAPHKVGCHNNALLMKNRPFFIDITLPVSGGLY